jgi:hypothetical protein
LRKNERSAPVPMLKKEKVILQLLNVANNPVYLRLALEGNHKRTVNSALRKGRNRLCENVNPNRKISSTPNSFIRNTHKISMKRLSKQRIHSLLASPNFT